MLNVTTCQICGRAIKANNKKGKIAHHGYTRPGWGHQTSSCPGARYLPYEVSRDRIPEVIKNLRGWIKMREDRLAEIVAEPPGELTYVRGTWQPKTFTVTRPDGFDPAVERESNIPYTYASEYWGLRRKLVGDIAGMKGDIAYLQKRYDEWVAPAPITEVSND